MSDLPLCECGCGERVSKKGNRFINGHNRREVKLSPEMLEKISGENASRGFLGKKHSAKSLEKMANKHKIYWSDQANRDAASKRTTDYFEDQNNRNRASSIATKRWSDQKNCDAMSDTMIEKWAETEYRKDQTYSIASSDNRKIAIEEMKGGNDICEHHYIYDHSDLSKYIMKMTRSRHQRLHRLMQKAGIKVPHINVKEDN